MSKFNGLMNSSVCLLIMLRNLFCIDTPSSLMMESKSSPTCDASRMAPNIETTLTKSAESENGKQKGFFCEITI